ncbi:very short patch repair endonuclease [Niastella vici]|uniref:Very short patch repair endonuclease n=1 Tax=Niastella vici TaxID=1703345 RepID=A0A1V9FUC6_9BACT|nr:very short patch repair endonuclease [Niastella vici]OQP61908.1 very short patch repair endonuclease [Niastella vici]
MADVHSKEIRSFNMSRIKGTNTKPEMILRKFLFANGFRYRLHVKSLPGRPDVVLSKYKTVLFVHGCFWHGHDGCKYFKIPSTRKDWWIDKINRTKLLDEQNKEKLIAAGWKVFEIWECDLKDKTVKELQKLISILKKQ